MSLQRWEYLAFPLLVALVIALPLFEASNGYLHGLFSYAFVFALFALSVNVMLGWAGEIPLGLSLFYGIGAYASALLMRDQQWDFVSATIAAMAISALLALLLGAITLRISGAYFAIVSWGIAAVAVVVATNWDSLTGGELGLYGIPSATIGPLDLTDTRTYLWVCGVVLVLVVTMLILLRRSRFGTRLAGGRINPRLAASVGINTYRDRLLAYALSAPLAALAGALTVPHLAIVTPGTLSVFTTVDALVIVLIGGTRYTLGPVLGALFYEIVPEVLGLEAEVKVAVFAAIIILVVLISPEGLPDAVRRLVAWVRARLADPRMGRPVEVSER